MNNPLISICVITYNSSVTILETLDSIKEQNYKNIELVIADDGSVDETVCRCQEWLKKNECFFRNACILTVDHNTGVPANLNRAIRNSRGAYIKILAGDDLLTEHCIQDFVDYIHKHPNAQVVFSRCEKFEVVNGEKRSLGISPADSELSVYELDARSQLLAMYFFLLPFPGPVAMIRRDVYERVIYDERFDALEDYPFYIAVLQNGIHIDLLNKVNVLWRKGESLCRAKKNFVNERLQRSKDLHFLSCIYPQVKDSYPEILQFQREIHFLRNFMITVLHNKRSLWNRFIVSILRRYYEHKNKNNYTNFLKKHGIEI